MSEGRRLSFPRRVTPSEAEFEVTQADLDPIPPPPAEPERRGSFRREEFVKPLDGLRVRRTPVR